MEDAINTIYNISFDVWNKFMDIAIKMFTTSPSEVSDGKLYELIHFIYLMISDISLPIATVFFLLAIIKNVVGTPPEQQLRKFFSDALKYVVILCILANLWDVMGAIMSVADGVTSKIASATGNSIMDLSNSSLASAISDVCSQEPQTQVGFLDVSGLLKWLGEYVIIQLQVIALLIASIITLIVIISASLSVLSGAFTRVLKPLLILPFSAITVAMASGSNESERITFNYLKTFFAFCISGAYMVIAVRVGNILATTTFSSLNGGGSVFGIALMASIQCAVAPVVIAGLIKGTDSVLSRFF